MSEFHVSNNREEAVIVVDTFSTGAVLCHELYQEHFKIICVLSGDLKDLLNMIPSGLDFQFYNTLILETDIDYEQAIQNLLHKLHQLPVTIKAVIAGAETGVELADQLSERMQLLTNGTELTEARRNKYIMGETIRAAGLRAVKQLKATTWEEIETYIQAWNPSPFQVIVKPMDSAGSDGVTLCYSLEEIHQTFNELLGKVNGIGMINRAVLVQEYLEGQEYIVDMVSRDGEHKVAGIWSYDRRHINGGAFVCFGQRLLTIHDPNVKELIEYQRKVITALGIRNGPTHGEVKWFQNEPVLVEVGARCQGGDGFAVKITRECLGYDQVQATIYAYLFPEKFALLPSDPIQRLNYGLLKWLINYQEGYFLEMNTQGLQTMKDLASYRGHQIFFPNNKYVYKTSNCFTWGGCLQLIHAQEEQLEHDYQIMEELEKHDFFMIQLETK